jgi:hypothetical protein
VKRRRYDLYTRCRKNGRLGDAGRVSKVRCIHFEQSEGIGLAKVKCIVVR